MRIVLDAMGTDEAPSAEVAGAIGAVRLESNSDVEIILVGDEGLIHAELANHVDVPGGIVVHRSGPGDRERLSGFCDQAKARIVDRGGVKAAQGRNCRCFCERRVDWRSHGIFPLCFASSPRGRAPAGWNSAANGRRSLSTLRCWCEYRL